MRNLFCLFAGLIVLATIGVSGGKIHAARQDSEERKAEIRVLKSDIELGEFAIDSVAHGEARIVNIGEVPLVIRDAFSNCGCTVADYPREPIVPGDTAVISVTYRSTDRLGGRFRKIVRVKTNAMTPLVSLYVTGTVRI